MRPFALASEIVIPLATVVDALEVVGDEFSTYLNKRTGEIVHISDEEVSWIEENRSLEELPDWQREMVALANEVAEKDDYLELPTQFDIHEYEIMRNFCYTVSDEKISDALFASIRGRGAFRRFKDTLIRYGIRDDWFAFRAKALEEIAIEWLEDNDLAYI